MPRRKNNNIDTLPVFRYPFTVYRPSHRMKRESSHARLPAILRLPLKAENIISSAPHLYQQKIFYIKRRKKKARNRQAPLPSSLFPLSCHKKSSKTKTSRCFFDTHK